MLAKGIKRRRNNTELRRGCSKLVAAGGDEIYEQRGHSDKKSGAGKSMPSCSAEHLNEELTDSLLQEDIKAMVPSAASLL